MAEHLQTSSLGEDCLVLTANRIDGHDMTEVTSADVSAILKLNIHREARQLVSHLVCPIEDCVSECIFTQDHVGLAFVIESASGITTPPINCIEGNSF